MTAKHSRAAPVLRQQAETRLLKKAAPAPGDVAALSPEATSQLLHELHVHQIELEMQNEELRESQAALEAVRARYFDLYDLAPVGYCTLSESGLIMQANLCAATLLGVHRAELVGKPLTRFIHKEDADRYYLHRKQLVEKGDAQACELRMIRKDGLQIWAHLAATTAHNEDGALELRVMLDDITERKNVELKLNEAKLAAEKANRAKTEFLSSMSHELRTPLNAILGFAQLMEAGTPAPTDSQKGSIERILKAGWYLLELINEILDLAKVESGTLMLSNTPVALADVMLECHAMIEPQAHKRGIGIAFPSFDAPCFVLADRTRLTQVLANLLSNAIKYNRPAGSVKVECVLKGASAIRISVRDTGMGLTKEQLAQLFQPFNRLGKEATNEEGTGIGLVVTKRLIELMGGTIGVESKVGAGSIFWIELGLATPPKLESQRLSLSVPARLDGTLLRTLLYVEDNPANLELVQQILARRPDLRLVTATDGSRGIELARSHQPEVVLMDINLPGMSGIDAMKILRLDPSTGHIPIIAISANAMPHDVEQALSVGFFRYITKPVRINELVDALDLALQMSALAAKPQRSA